MAPRIGDIVIFRLTEEDAMRAAARIAPAIVTEVFTPTNEGAGPFAHLYVIPPCLAPFHCVSSEDASQDAPELTFYQKEI